MFQIENRQSQMLEILESGFLTTLQDGGRVGYQKLGITTSGALDEFSRRCANTLVRNPRDAAVLEITASGPTLQARANCLIAVTGAEMPPRVNGQARSTNTALFIRAGSVIDFTSSVWGARAYLAVAGGFDVPRVLDARATDLRAGIGGIEGRALQAGDVLTIGETHQDIFSRAGTMLNELARNFLRDDSPLRVVRGSHSDFFDDEAKFFAFAYAIGDASDRMAFRLRGEKIERRAGEILSCGTALGAIQAPNDGQPIVLMAERQTTGGYPIIGCVIRADIPRLAQKLPGEVVRFEPVSLEQAREKYLEMEKMTGEIK